MSFIDKIVESAGFIRKTKASSPGVSSSGASDPFLLWRSSKKIDPAKAFDAFAGWTYACVRAISEEISNMKFKLIRVTADGTEEEVYTHPLLDLLDGVNDYQTGLELRYTIAAHLETVGNAFIYLDGVEKEGDLPKALYILDASRVKIIADREHFPGSIQKYEYRLPTLVYTFEPFKIIHLKSVDPRDQFEGIGTVQTAAQWIDADNYAMEFNRRFFLNGARIGGVIEAQQAYATDQLEYMKKSFEAVHKGVDNAHKILALPQGVTYKESTAGMKDMDFATLMDVMRDRILAAFRVPRTVLGITDDVNRANAETTDYVFAARTIKPKMQQICSYLNEFFVPLFEDDMYLTFEDPVPKNRELMITEMAATDGILSPNEKRERYFGLSGIDNGEEVLIPFNLTPLGAPVAKEMSKPAVKTSKVSKKTTRFARSAKLRKGIASDIAKKVAESIKQMNKAVSTVKKKKNITELDNAAFAPIYKAFATRVTTYEKKINTDVRSFNKKQEKEVLANLETVIKSYKKKTKAIDESGLFDIKKAVSAFIDLATPILTDLFIKEGKEAAALIGVDNLDPLTPEAKTALDESINLLSTKYNEDTMALLKTKLEQGIQDGASLPEMQDLVSQIYEFSDETRAQRVARTETFRVANSATKSAWKQTGVVKTIKWYTAEDEKVCPWCDAEDGKVVSIDDNFYDQGDKVIGTDGSTLALDYSDVGAPPLHVSCRCYVRPEDISIE